MSISTSHLRITVPVKILPAMLHASDVPEADYLAWASGTTYVLGDRVIHQHAIYESAQAANTGNNPATAGAAWWLKVSATNRWKLFDLEQVTTTQQATAMSYQLKPGVSINSVHVLGLHDVDSVQLRVYDEGDVLQFDSGLNAAGMLPDQPDWWAYCFGPWVVSDQQHYRGLPYLINPRIQVDFAGGADMGVQVLMLGNDHTFGQQEGAGVLSGVRVRFERPTDFRSNDFDIPTMRTGALVTTVLFNMRLLSQDVDTLVDFYRDHGADVCMFTVSDRWRTTQVLGRITSMEPLINGPLFSEFAFEIRGVPQQ